MNKLDSGIDYFYKQEYVKALSCFLEVLSQGADVSVNNYNVALAYDAMGEFDLAIAFYKKAISLNSSDIRSMNNLALICFKINEENAALAWLDKAIEINPYEAEAYSQMGTYYKEKSDFKMAENYYNKAKNLDNKFFYNYYNLALLYLQMNDKVKAKENFELCLSINPDFNLAIEELKKLQ